MLAGAGLTEQAQRFAGYAALPASQVGLAVSRATLTFVFLQNYSQELKESGQGGALVTVFDKAIEVMTSRWL